MRDHFDDIHSDWYQPLLLGGGRLERGASTLRLVTPPMSRHVYTDAQIDDYHGLRRSRFPWRPPLRLRLRARLSHPASTRPAAEGAPALRGTAGFGFWNDPFSLSGGVLTAPNTVWFFYASPPSDLALAPGVPGWGWKAAVLNAGRAPSLLLAPVALAAVGLIKVPGLGRRVMSVARRAVRAGEAIVSAGMEAWHVYELEWRTESATFRVDGEELLRAPNPPRGPLGFVAWVDNQYAVASVEGKFGFGLVDSAEEQWLELDEVLIEPMAQARQT